MNIWLRITIIISATIAIWLASDAFPLVMRTLAKPREVAWFDFLTALGVGVLGPALAIVAIVLAAANRRLATIIWVLALVVYIAPLAAFAISVAISGF
jgi:hypothetical protein